MANDLASSAIHSFERLPETDPKHFGDMQVPIDVTAGLPFGRLPLATNYCDALASVLINPAPTSDSMADGAVSALLKLQMAIPEQVNAAFDRLIAGTPKKRLEIIKLVLSAHSKTNELAKTVLEKASQQQRPQHR
jgi:hypothetical protein